MNHIQKKSKNKSIAHTLVKLLIFCSFIPVLIIFAVSYLTFSNVLINRNNTTKTSSVGIIQNESLKLNTQTASTLESVAKGTMLNGSKFDAVQIGGILKLVANSNKDIVGATFVDSKNHAISTTKSETYTNAKNTEWYKKAVNNEGKIIWTSPYLDDQTDSYVKSCAIAVRNQSNQLGVVSLEITYKNIEFVVKKMKVATRDASHLFQNQHGSWPQEILRAATSIKKFRPKSMHSSAAMTFQTIPSSRQLKMLRQDKAISEFQTVKQNTSAVPKKIREASYVY